MIRKKYKYINSNLVFLIAWILYFVTFMVKIYSKVNLSSYSYVYYLIESILIFKILFMDKPSIKRIIIYSVILVISIINAYIIKDNLFTIIILFIIAAKDINFKNFLKVDFCVRLIILIVIISLSLVGAIPLKTINATNEYSLGFVHANTFAMYVSVLLVEYMVIKKCNLKKIDFMVILSIIVITYLISKSRTSALATGFILLIILLFNNKNNIFRKKYINILLVMLPLLFVLTSFLLIFLYKTNNYFANEINSLLSDRMRLGQKYFDEYGMELFAKKIEQISTEKAKILGIRAKVLDIAYIHLGIRHGIISLILFTMALTIINYYAIKKQKKELFFANVFFMIVGLFETYMFILCMNFLLINTNNYFGYIFKNINTSKINEKWIKLKKYQ